jgi:hypothetical protein
MPPTRTPRQGAAELDGFYSLKYQQYRKGLLRRQPLLALPVHLHEVAHPRTSPAVETKRRRLREAIALGTPDRVPVITNPLNFYPAQYASTTFADYSFSRKACSGAFLKFIRDHRDFDAVFPSHLICWGQLMTALDLDVIQLPGVHLPENVSFQYVERERLMPEEYPMLISGGYDFFKHNILPRMTPRFDSRKGWDASALLRLSLAGLQYGVFYLRTTRAVERTSGVPVSPGAFTVAPFDLISFLFRDLPGVSQDLFRRPEMVEKTVDMLSDTCILMAEAAAAVTGIRETVIFCERAFSLSPRQFERFYYPGLARLVDALIDRAILPTLALEGDCTHVLDQIVGLPAGRCMIALDTTDISKANEILKGRLCFTGNVPMNLMVLGEPAEVRDACAKLIDECAPGGGFVMSGALGIPDNARPENVRAMLDYTIEHGSYS